MSYSWQNSHLLVELKLLKGSRFFVPNWRGGKVVSALETHNQNKWLTCFIVWFFWYSNSELSAFWCLFHFLSSCELICNLWKNWIRIPCDFHPSDFDNSMEPSSAKRKRPDSVANTASTDNPINGEWTRCFWYVCNSFSLFTLSDTLDGDYLNTSQGFDCLFWWNRRSSLASYRLRNDDD